MINTFDIKKENTEAVDAGEFAAKLLKQKSVKPPPLTLSDVYEHLKAIALNRGKGSREKKYSYLTNLPGFQTGILLENA